MNGTGGGGGDVPGDENITVGCANNASDFILILNWQLFVEPEGTVTANAEFTAEIEGVAFFSKAFLDAGLALFPGLTRASLTAVSATVSVRSGATGDDVVLVAPEIDGECSRVPAECEVDSDCAGFDFGEFCARYIELPISKFCDSVAFPEDGDGTCDEACAPGGVCESFSVGETQCLANDYCVLSDLALQLAPQTATFTAAAEGPALFGWWDDDQAYPKNDDGTYQLPAGAPTTDPVPPLALQVVAGAVPIALECVMAVDSGSSDGVATCSGGDNDGTSCERPQEGKEPKLCFGGINDGEECGGSSECRASICKDGADQGDACTSDDDCTGSECVVEKYCEGGPNDGEICVTASECEDMGTGGVGGAPPSRTGELAPGACANEVCGLDSEGKGVSCEPAGLASPTPDAELIQVEF